MTIEDARAEHFDVAVATGWETAPVLFRIPADRYVCLLRSLAETELSERHTGAPGRVAHDCAARALHRRGALDG